MFARVVVVVKSLVVIVIGVADEPLFYCLNNHNLFRVSNTLGFRDVSFAWTSITTRKRAQKSCPFVDVSGTRPPVLGRLWCRPRRPSSRRRQIGRIVGRLFAFCPERHLKDDSMKGMKPLVFVTRVCLQNIIVRLDVSRRILTRSL